MLQYVDVPGDSWAQGWVSDWGLYRADADMELHFFPSIGPLWLVTFKEPPPLTVGSPLHVEEATKQEVEKKRKHIT